MAASTDDFNCRRDRTAAVSGAFAAAGYRRMQEYCKEPRSREEMQNFCGIKTREYFRKKILSPMIQAGMLMLTKPDKPKSPDQKYYAVNI